MRPPRVSVITFTSYICCIYALKFGQYWTLFCAGNSSVPKRLIYSFCSSDRGFASDFLQTPSHGGRPCLWLTVPTAKPVADFHRQVITHAEHTTKKSKRIVLAFLVEAPPGFEPGDRAFAELCLTTWLWRRIQF